MTRGFAAFVMVFVAGKTFEESELLLVQEFKNYKKPGPPRIIWRKTAGGRHDDWEFPNETPEECACRRLFGETGILLTPAQLKKFRVVPREAHDKYFYGVRLDACPDLVPYGDRHNVISKHTPKGFATLKEDGEVHPEHSDVLADFLEEMKKSYAQATPEA